MSIFEADWLVAEQKSVNKSVILFLWKAQTHHRRTIRNSLTRLGQSEYHRNSGYRSNRSFVWLSQDHRPWDESHQSCSPEEILIYWHRGWNRMAYQKFTWASSLKEGGAATYKCSMYTKHFRIAINRQVWPFTWIKQSFNSRCQTISWSISHGNVFSLKQVWISSCARMDTI